MSEAGDTVHVSRTSLLGRIGVNIRGLVVIFLVVTVCCLCLMNTEIPERLKDLVSAAVGYYFGQQHQKPNT